SGSPGRTRDGDTHGRLLRPRRSPPAGVLRLLLYGAELQHPSHPGDTRDAATRRLGPDPRDPGRGGRDLSRQGHWPTSGSAPASLQQTTHGLRIEPAILVLALFVGWVVYVAVNLSGVGSELAAAACGFSVALLLF